MGMFDNYDNEKNIPCNVHEYLIVPEENYIIEGATCYNTFKLLFKYDDSMQISITYYQEERLTLTKENSDLYIVKLEDSFIVKCRLSSEETFKFANTNLDTYAQVRVVVDNKIIFGKKSRIRVIETIEEKQDGQQ